MFHGVQATLRRRYRRYMPAAIQVRKDCEAEGGWRQKHPM